MNSNFTQPVRVYGEYLKPKYCSTLGSPFKPAISHLIWRWDSRCPDSYSGAKSQGCNCNSPCILQSYCPVSWASLISAIYPGINELPHPPDDHFASHTILTSRNDDMDNINENMLTDFPGGVLECWLDQGKWGKWWRRVDVSCGVSEFDKLFWATSAQVKVESWMPSDDFAKSQCRRRILQWILRNCD